jgi:hypothetical protein
MKGGCEVDRAEQRARRLMKGEGEKERTQQKATEVWNEE